MNTHENFAFVKKLLKDETKIVPYCVSVKNNEMVYADSPQVTAIPILHNDKEIILQLCGWSINLHEDGTWEWEDTTGG